MLCCALQWLSQLLGTPFLAALETQNFVNNPQNWYVFNFYQHVHCVCRCADACRLLRISPAACWCCSSSNLCSETLLETAKRCNLYIHTDFWLKFCLLYWAASKLPRLLDTASKFALFSCLVWKTKSWSKPTWKMKHTNAILESFEYFCQSSKSTVIISSYAVLKLGRFLRHSACITEWRKVFESRCHRLLDLHSLRLETPTMKPETNDDTCQSLTSPTNNNNDDSAMVTNGDCQNDDECMASEWWMPEACL